MSDHLDQRERLTLVVAGMHRSGTSALSHLAVRLGFKAPLKPIPGNETNPDGHFEPLPLARFNDEILEAHGGHWADWRPLERTAPPGVPPLGSWTDPALALLRAAFPAGDSVLKEPRISRLGPLWREVLMRTPGRTVVALIVRNPLEVAQSLHKRNGLSVSHGLLLWLRYTLEAERFSRAFPRTLMTYGQLQDDWGATAVRLSDTLGIVWPIPVADLNAEGYAPVDTTLRNQRATRSDLEAEARVPPEVREVYALLVCAARTGALDEAASARLDAIAEAFDAACATVHGAAEESVVVVDESRDAIAALTAERDKLRTRIETLENALQAARQDADARAKSYCELFERTAGAVGELNASAAEARRAMDKLAHEINAVGTVSPRDFDALVESAGKP